MSYCRVGRDSDVYVISTHDGQFSCVGCPKAPDLFKTRKEIYNHLIEHQLSADKVPEDVMRRLIAEYQDEVQAIKAKWTFEEARALLDQLSTYYGEPVKPISQYCNAFRTWHDAVEVGLTKAEEDTPEKAALESMVGALREVALMVSKSNLLARLLYEGEELRTEPCPIHKGHWSGCAWGANRCPHCMSGDNVTGWIALASRR